MKEVSVIIPCYNAAPWMDRCLTSVMEQTTGTECLEVICIDDASTDDTWECLQKWEERFPESMLLMRLEENRKLGYARNTGLQYASGDWVAFVDADDWLEPDYFEILLKSAVRFHPDVVCCRGVRDRSGGLVCFDRDRRTKKEEKHIVADTEEKVKELLVSAALGPAAWGKIIRKSLLTDAQLYFPEGMVYEDMYWSPLLCMYAKEICMTEENLYHYFVNPHSITLSRENAYQMDLIKVQMLKRTDYEKRGMLRRYPAELEYDLLCNAVDFMKRFIFRCSSPPFSLFCAEQELMRAYAPDYKRNPYVAGLGELPYLLLEILYAPIDETGLSQIVKEVKSHWSDYLLS